MGLLLEPAGAFIGSGGGISLYEPEPAYQQGVQSTGSRTTPDVSLVADPATGAWIADPYNLDPSESVRGRGRHQLVGPGLGGPAGAGQSGPGGRGQSDTEQRQPDRNPASPLHAAPERLQRDRQRQQRLHRRRRLQPGDRLGDPHGQLCWCPTWSPTRGPARPTPARPLRRCKMPVWSMRGRATTVRWMSSACLTRLRSRATTWPPAPAA